MNRWFNNNDLRHRWLELFDFRNQNFAVYEEEFHDQSCPTVTVGQLGLCQ